MLRISPGLYECPDEWLYKRASELRLVLLNSHDRATWWTWPPETSQEGLRHSCSEKGTDLRSLM